VISSSAGNCGLIIFLRFPEVGKVKSRLAETLGHETAFKIYLELSEITLQLAKSVTIPVYLFYTGGLPDFKDRYPTFHYLQQAEGDLGEKMMDAFQYVLDRHHKAIIIGSDCPYISNTDLFLAIELQDTHDVVLGPSTDGGYYLLGCKKMHPLLFDSIAWSTSSVLDQTIEKIKQSGLSYSLLQTLSDIDTEEDWVRYNTGT
jgi:rSAM/selenodomain-associated transferase 1